jgi:hypothetical protein
MAGMEKVSVEQRSSPHGFQARKYDSSNTNIAGKSEDVKGATAAASASAVTPKPVVAPAVEPTLVTASPFDAKKEIPRRAPPGGWTGMDARDFYGMA